MSTQKGRLFEELNQALDVVPKRLALATGISQNNLEVPFKELIETFNEAKADFPSEKAIIDEFAKEKGRTTYWLLPEDAPAIVIRLNDARKNWFIKWFGASP